MRWILIVGGVAAAAPAAAQMVEVTLGEAVQRALQVQPDMVAARGAQRSMGAARRTALGAFLPNLRLNSSVSKSSQRRPDPNGPGTIPPIPNYGSSVSADVDLFTGFRRLFDLRGAGADLDAAESGVVVERYRVQLLTKEAFYGALAAEELVRVAEAQVRRAQQQLQISIEKLRAGSATRSDSLRSTVDYGNARIALLQARANLASAQASLGRQIGVDQPVRAVPDTAFPPLPDTAALRRTALESVPLVEQAEADARAARASVWAARSQYWPTLRLSWGSTRRDTLFSRAFVGNEENRWTVSLSWNIFDGFNREHQQVSASVSRDNAESRAADTRRQVNAELTQQLAALSTTYEQIGIARANVAAATEDLRVQSERYRVGAATILDLLTSQTALTEAEVNLVETRFNHLIARAQVEALLGRTL